VPLTILFTNNTYVKFNALDGSYNLRITTQFNYLSDIRFLVRSYNTDTINESTNLTAVQLDVNTDAQDGIAKMGFGVSNKFKQHKPFVLDFTDTGTYHDYTMEEGRVICQSATRMFFKAFCQDINTAQINFDGDLEFDNTSITGNVTSSFLLGIDGISADEIYLGVNRLRRARINFNTGLIQAASFTFNADLGEMKKATAIYQTATETYYQIYDATRAKFIPFMRLNTSGNLAFAFDVKMIRS